MTRLFNDPTDFLDERVDGFVAASGRWVRALICTTVVGELPAAREGG